MPMIEVNGLSVYVEIEGNGAELILLHGLGANHLYWKREIDQLKEHYRVVALDSRGHGKSDKPSSYTLQDHIKDVISLMAELGLTSANLMGVSAGSYIAQGVAIANPQLVQKLILLATKPKGIISSTQSFLERHAKELEGFSEEAKQQFLFKHIFYNFDAFMKASALFLSEPLTFEQQETANRALKGFDFRRDLHKVTANTLVISGRYDVLNPPEEGRECASLIPSATFVEMGKSGHAPNMEEPELFMQIVKKFLNE